MQIMHTKDGMGRETLAGVAWNKTRFLPWNFQLAKPPYNSTFINIFSWYLGTYLIFFMNSTMPDKRRVGG